MRKLRLCRIDRNGCVSCGCRRFRQTNVINEALASSWELSARERAAFDEREGKACINCGMSKRVRMLLWSLKRLFPEGRDLRVVHFNQINQLGPALQALGDVIETCYHAELERGVPVGASVNEDMCRLTFPDNHFDLAVHSETLEHLFDFNQALSEIRRVLKPGGMQVYSVPLLHGRQTRQRIRKQANNGIVYLHSPSHHGNEGEFPVVWEFGRDFIDRRASQIQQIHYDNYWTNRTVFTVVEVKV